MEGREACSFLPEPHGLQAPHCNPGFAGRLLGNTSLDYPEAFGKISETKRGVSDLSDIIKMFLRRQTETKAFQQRKKTRTEK